MRNTGTAKLTDETFGQCKSIYHKTSSQVRKKLSESRTTLRNNSKAFELWK